MKYIFGVVADLMPEDVKRDRIKQATKTLNKYLKKMSVKLELGSKITTMHARHSFATMLKNAGEDVAYISEAMGHTNIKTTENYLSSFDEEKRKQAAKSLMDF